MQSILKSPELDAKYEKYSNASPKTSRRKFLLSRQPVLGIRRKSRKASSKTRESPANGSSSSTIHELEIVPSGLPSLENNGSVSQASVPLAVTAKYDVGSVIGDGKFLRIEARAFCHLSNVRYFKARSDGLRKTQ